MNESEITTAVSQAISKFNNSKKLIRVDDLLEELEDLIVNAHDRETDMRSFKGIWMKRLKDEANNMNVQLDNRSASWHEIEKRLHFNGTESADSSGEPTPISSSSAASSLKVQLSEKDKQAIKELYDTLDKSKFWYLNATKKRAQVENKIAEAVEEKMQRFALSCNYIHLCHSLMIDLDDANWATVFNEEELKEMREYGDPVLRDLPNTFNALLDNLGKQTSVLDAFFYAQNLRCHPIEDPITTWVQLSVMTTSKLLLNSTTSNDALLECDKLYNKWGFVNTIFQGSTIQALGKEKASKASSVARNSKRKLSSIEAIDSKKRGHKVDTLYIASNVELGCLEIKGNDDDTKEKEDSRIKLPTVLRDMLLQLLNVTPSMLRKAHMIGYNIDDNTINMLDVDSPQGYVTRIRRVAKQPYPTISDDYVPRMIPLLQLAFHGKLIMEDTINEYRRTQIPLSVATGRPAVFLPPSFSPHKPASYTSSSTSSVASKRQK